MAGSINMVAPGNSIQRQNREWTDEFSDQHGRRFSAVYDKGNMRPIGEMSPVGFAPPWLPPSDCIIWERHGGFRFRWDYDRLAREYANGSEQFYTEVMEFMLEHMPNDTPPEVDEPIPAKARRLFKPPLSAAIPLAAEAGEPWILGEAGAPVSVLLKELLAQSVNANGREAVAMIRERTKARIAEGNVKTVPTIAPEVLPETRARTINSIDTRNIASVTYQEFIGAAMKDGLSMARAAEAWASHKANQADENAVKVA